MANPSDAVQRIHALVSGLVQGVAYRAFAQDEAVRRGLVGGVRNLDDGRVEIIAEGVAASLETFLQALRAGPPRARVADLEVKWELSARRYTDFDIWY